MQTTEEEKPKRYTPSKRKAAAAAPAVEVKETPAKPKRGLNEILHDLDRDVFGDDEEDEDGGGEE